MFLNISSIFFQGLFTRLKQASYKIRYYKKSNNHIYNIKPKIKKEKGKKRNETIKIKKKPFYFKGHMNFEFKFDFLK